MLMQKAIELLGPIRAGHVTRDAQSELLKGCSAMLGYRMQCSRNEAENRASGAGSARQRQCRWPWQQRRVLRANRFGQGQRSS
jgi:hypothetical protein